MIPPTDFDLLHAYLDDELPAEQARAVEARLKAEPALADALITLARDEAVLAEWASCEAETGRQGDRETRRQGSLGQDSLHGAGRGSVAGGVRHNETNESGRRTALSAGGRRVAVPPRLARWVIAVGAVAAAVALALGIAGRFRTPAEAPPVAFLEDPEGEVEVFTDPGQAAAAEDGQKLFAGQWVRTRGEASSVVVQYGDARVELGGDTQIHLGPAGARRIEVEQGVGDVSRQSRGQPLLLTTPHAELWAEGGRFSFASLPGATYVQSEEGGIKVTSRRNGDSTLVRTGYYAVATAQPEALEPLPVPDLRAVLKDDAGPVTALAYLARGRLVSGGWKGLLKLWGPPAPGAKGAVTVADPADALGAHAGRVLGLAASADGNLLATLGDDRTVRFWDLTAGRDWALTKPPRPRVLGLALSPDGRTLATACEDKTVRLWDVATGAERVVIKGHHKYKVTAVAFSPDGKALVSAGGQGKEAGEVLLWDVADFRVKATPAGHEGEVVAVTFSPDGRVLATASRDGTVRLWDAAAGAELRTLRGHAGTVNAAAFSPDGRLLATAGGDGTVKLWDVAGGRERVSFRAHKNNTCCAAFAPDGKTLATGGWDKTVKLWDLSDVDGRRRA